MIVDGGFVGLGEVRVDGGEEIAFRVRIYVDFGSATLRSFIYKYLDGSKKTPFT